MSTREVVVVGGARTGIGDYGGSLRDVAPTRLGAIAIREALARAKVDPASVGHVVMGSVIHGEVRDMYLSRVAALDAGLPVGTPCLTVNRLCGSGLQAIVSAAQHILLGDTDVVVGGGAESMSRAAYFLPAGRWGQRMGDGAVVDAMTGALHDPFGHGHMGITAENIAAKYGFTRQQQDCSRSSRTGAPRTPWRRVTSRARSCGGDQVEEGRRAFTSMSTSAPGPGWKICRSSRPCSRRTARSPGQRLGPQRRRRRHRDDGSGHGEEKGTQAHGAPVAYAHAGVEPQNDGASGPSRGEALFEKSAEARRHGRGRIHEASPRRRWR